MDDFARVKLFTAELLSKILPKTMYSNRNLLVNNELKELLYRFEAASRDTYFTRNEFALIADVSERTLQKHRIGNKDKYPKDKMVIPDYDTGNGIIYKKKDMVDYMKNRDNKNKRKI